MKGLIFILFVAGIAATVVFFVYLLSGVLYVFSDAEYPGLITWVPKWIFLFVPLVFLGRTKAVDEVIGRLPL